MQADRQKLLQLLTGYELAVTGHEGYAKVREVFSIQHLFCRYEPRAYLGGVGSVLKLQSLQQCGGSTAPSSGSKRVCVGSTIMFLQLDRWTVS